MIPKVGISFGLVDVTAKPDTTAAITDKQPWIDPQDLSLEGVSAIPAATLEQNYWKLDGTFVPFPDKPENSTWGVWSGSMSGEDGAFATPIVLTLTFRENHSSIGLSFEFNPHGTTDWCNDLNIQWYNGAALLVSRDFQPDKWRYACMEAVENYNKVVITFRSMSKPYRYLKVQNILHGITKEFSDSEITQASILEEIDPTSATLSVNTLDFKLHSQDEDFNIFNPRGIYNLLQKKQQLSVEGNRDGQIINLGTYYVENWESESDNIIRISAQDAIGVMDGAYFAGGIYNNVTAGNLLETIMTDAHFGYSLDSTLASVPVSGWLPRCTHREALQQLAFAIGGYVDTSRSGTVNVWVLSDASTSNKELIGRDRKWLGTKVRLKPYVSGVSVTEHNYTMDTAASELFKGTLETGDQEILFSEPAANLTVSGAVLKESGVNHCVVTVSTAGEVTVSGKKYIDNTRIVTKKSDQILAGEKENILEVTGATLVSDGAAAAERLFSYHQRRIEQEMNFVLGNEKPGSLVSIETSEAVWRDAVMESLDIDLTGGFAAKGVAVGE